MQENPKAGYARFVLSYHYLVLGSKAEALAELQQVIKLQPEDKVAAALAKAPYYAGTAGLGA